MRKVAYVCRREYATLTRSSQEELDDFAARLDGFASFRPVCMKCGRLLGVFIPLEGLGEILVRAECGKCQE